LKVLTVMVVAAYTGLMDAAPIANKPARRTMHVMRGMEPSWRSH
jgi:hypothetical protein